MSAKKRKDSRQNTRDEEITVDPAALARLTLQARNLLAFHLELGIADFPVTPELRNFLVKRQPVAAVHPVHREMPVEKTVPDAKGSAKSARLQLETIALELSDCRHCESASGSVVSGQGSAASRLFVVGDYCRGTNDNAAMVWGVEEDELFWKMMAAIGLDKESLYVTNCIKCCQDEALQPDTTLGRSCFSFLERELIAMQPGLICTMGELATSLLLGSRTPLVRMRGRFHQYRYPHGGSAQVMPTFHPAFLLQHPEMKRAAWMDLQALQRRLQGTT